MTATPNTTVIPEGCSIAIPLGDGVSPLAKLWEETRSQEVAQRLIDLSEAYASFFRRKLPKKGPRFDEVATAGDSRDLSLVLQSITHCSETKAAERLMLVFENHKYDPRLLVYLERWRARNPRPYPSGLNFDAMLDLCLGEIRAYVPEHKADHKIRATLTEEDRVVLGRADDLLASIPKRRKALELLHAVYNHPGDIARRLVFSDALMELGDPSCRDWGELIALQCARLQSPEEPSKKAIKHEERLLASVHQHAWVGRLAMNLPTTTTTTTTSTQQPAVIFEGGFPAHVTTSTNARTVGIKEWATVKTIHPPPHAWTPAWLTTLSLFKCAKVLRVANAVVVGLPARVVTTRSTDRQLPAQFPTITSRCRSLEHLALRIVPGRDLLTTNTFFRAWGNTRAFPNLKRLDLCLYSAADVEAALTLVDKQVRLVKKLTDMGFQMRLPMLIPSLVSRLAKAQSSLFGITFHSIQDSSWVRFNAPTKTLRLGLGGAIDMRAIGNALQEAGLHKLEVEPSKTTPWTKQLEAAWNTSRVRNVKLEIIRAS